ncbi:MAG: ABC transporter substrate-binding protein, partial [Rhodoferax sp.]
MPAFHRPPTCIGRFAKDCRLLRWLSLCLAHAGGKSIEVWFIYAMSFLTGELMRHVSKWLGLLSCALVLASGQVQARDWKTIKDSGTAVVATEGAYYPFNYFDGPKLTGFEVELAEAVVKQMGLKLEWRVVAFDAQLASIRQDRFDFAIASHGYTEERAKSVDFAGPHYCSGAQIVSYPGGPQKVADLKGKSVGVQIATTYFDAAKK